MSLAGKTVLVTRARDQAAGIAAEIERRGGTSVVIPMIRILPPDRWDECDQAILALSEYDALVFSSVNAVEFFFGRSHLLSIESGSYRSKSVYAVGDRTRQALQQRGIDVTAVPEEQSGRGLLTALSDLEISGRCFLVPRGDLAREEVVEGLKERGGKVTTVTVYRTAGPDEESATLLRQMLRSGAIDVVTFFSPSAVWEVLRVADDATRAQLGRSILTAVVGMTTGAALTEQGIPVTITSPEPTAAVLVDEIERFLTV